FVVKVNGSPVNVASKPGSYVEIKRTWKTGDSISLTLPKTLRLESSPDNPRIAAVMWGPLVLAGDLGPEPERGAGRNGAQVSSPSFVAADKPLTDWLKPVADKSGDFHTVGVGRDRDVELVPFYRLQRRTYSIYWDLFTDSEWTKHNEAIA